MPRAKRLVSPAEKLKAAKREMRKQAADRIRASFRTRCLTAYLPDPVPEYHFHASRRWAFDYAFPQHKLAIEVQGGLFVNGRHSRGAALLKEHEKLNEAAAQGWRILYTTPNALMSLELLRTLSAALNTHRADPQERG